MYPSLDVEDAVRVVCEMFEESEVRIEGVDYEEVGLYLALNMDSREIEGKGLGRVCPTRKSNIGRKPEITGSGTHVQKVKRFDPWIKPTQQPDEGQKRSMLKEAIRVVVSVIMKNHTYEFNQEVRRQMKGGPIGMDLTGTVAKIYMKWWDGELLRRLQEQGIEVRMYERYVDDINMIVKATRPGVLYSNGGLVYNKKREEEEANVPADLRTFLIIRDIGNSVHPSIQLKIDVPSNYEDGKIPILNLKMWIGEVQSNAGEERKIVYEHYIKEIASKLVIERESAMAMSAKRTILTQMCLRAMLNCSPYLGEETRKKHVEFFMRRMQASGYNEKVRLEVLKSAVQAYTDICGEDGKPKHRGKEYNTPERRKEKSAKRRNWYRLGGHEAVLFIPATPHSRLKKMVEEEIRGTNFKIKVVERSGTKVKKILQKNDPFKGGHCGEERCKVCNTTGKGRCRRNGITYKMACKADCGGFEYKGETHGNAYSRGIQHENDLRGKVESSVMWKHCCRKHGGVEVEFEREVMDYIRNDPTLRQVTEAIRINETPEERRINDQTEWNVGRLPRLSVTN